MENLDITKIYKNIACKPTTEEFPSGSAKKCMTYIFQFCEYKSVTIYARWV